jgi:hypothetical protein
MAEDFDTHFQNNYNTSLSDENETRFNNWVAQEGKRRGRDMSGDTADYDLRGYWLNGGHKDTTGQGHMTDQYKKPNHPTFSNQSIYHGKDSPWGEPYQGGTWSQDAQGRDVYTPTATMLKYTHPTTFLQNYMRDREPGVTLILPK